jgi:heme exporter protein B
MATDLSRWMSEVSAVLAKDARSEYRSRAALNAILLFALTTLAVVSFQISAQGLAPGVKARLLASLLWIVLFFSAMSGLPRVFVKEEDSRTAMALRLSARPNVVFVGKLLFNVLLLLGVSAAVLPLYVVLMGPEIRDWGRLATVLALGMAGLAGASTLLAALISKTTNRGSLFVVLAFPILLPLLVCAINGSVAAFLGARPAEVRANLLVLAAYLVATVTASLMLFEYVWNE